MSSSLLSRPRYSLVGTKTTKACAGWDFALVVCRVRRHHPAAGCEYKGITFSGSQGLCPAFRRLYGLTRRISTCSFCAVGGTKNNSTAVKQTSCIEK